MSFNPCWITNSDMNFYPEIHNFLWFLNLCTSFGRTQADFQSSNKKRPLKSWNELKWGMDTSRGEPEAGAYILHLFCLHLVAAFTKFFMDGWVQRLFGKTFFITAICFSVSPAPILDSTNLVLRVEEIRLHGKIYM